MNPQQFLDKDGLNQFSDSIAEILKNSLATKADVNDVITIDYVNDNFLKKVDYISDQNIVWNGNHNDNINGINDKANINDVYTKTQIDTLLGGYLPVPETGTEYITNTYLTDNGYVTQDWVSALLNDYATQQWVIDQHYVTDQWVLNRIPNMNDYYTTSQVTDLLTGYAPISSITNLSNQLSVLSNTVNNYIVNGGGSGSESGGSDIVDLNNLYYWVNLTPNALVIHSGSTLENDPTDYHRCFITADMYRRNTTLFPLESYEMKLSAIITVNNISKNITGLHQDFSAPTILSTYCDQTVKNYFDNELIINNDGIYTSSLVSLLSSSSWNTFLSDFRDNYYKDINNGYDSHESSIDPTKTWKQEDETKGWTTEQGYALIIHNNETLVNRRAFLNSKLQGADQDTQTMIQERLEYLDSFLNNDHDKSLFEYLVLDPSIILSGTLKLSILPYNRETTQTGDPDDTIFPIPSVSTSDSQIAPWEYNRYTWKFNYKAHSWDDVATEQLEVRLYDNPLNIWSNDSTANNTIKNIYNSKGYYTQLNNNNSNYLDDQKYVNAYCVKKDSDNKYYFTYGEGLSKLSILKSNIIAMLNAFNSGTIYFHILHNGEDLDSSSAADLAIISDFINSYLINDDALGTDPMLSNIEVRYGQNIIYGFDKTYPTSRDLFEFLDENSSVKSLGGKTGDITFNTGPLSSNEVAFHIGPDNVLHGFAPADADVNPVGVIFMWPNITGLTPPIDYLLCDGSNYNQTEYPTLYSVIGNEYNDATTQTGQFRVPDMRGLITGINFIIKH